MKKEEKRVETIKEHKKQHTFTVAAHPRVTSPKGFAAAGIHAGIKRKRPDLGVLACEVPASAAAVYTTNAFQAPPLKVTQESIGAERRIQALVVNSGIANACTGQKGMEDAYQMRKKTAHLLGIPEHLVAVASTGVIGEYLPMEKVERGLDELIPQLQKEDDQFAEAILTTDTCTKQVEVALEIDGKQVKIAGVAKGSGMIKPNMATMLAFITTDAVIESDVLQSLLWQETDQSFNMITVDGDTSTNDMVITMASNLAGNKPLNRNHPDWNHFCAAFAYVCEELAKMIARDGEGATRLIEVKVAGADSDETARKVAKAVVGSNLVKAAIYGADANWGRIVCAAGYGAPNLNENAVEVRLGEIPVVRQGLPLPFDETEAANEFKKETVKITLDLHQGNGSATAWGCDLTYEYVRINASYRT
jgi:glutamate N-acetyltransferase/amino-acid N-acetyltransferase